MGTSRLRVMPKVDLRDFGRRVRAARGKKDIRHWATDVRVSHATISRVERGGVPDLHTFAQLCRVLRIDPSVVLGVDPGAGGQVR